MRRTELSAFGKDLVADRLHALGCRVERPRNPLDGRLSVRTPSSRHVEVFVSTQRVGGYAFWTKRRLKPSPERLAALVLLDAAAAGPQLYLVPSVDWLTATPPLTDRDYPNLKSEPEYGIELGPTKLPLLRRFGWTDARAAAAFA